MADWLDQAYEDACRATLATWALHADVGSVQPPAYHPTRWAISAGNYLPGLPAVAELWAELRRLTADDPLADLNSLECLHSTFLAVTGHTYDALSDLPELDELRRIFARVCHGKSYGLRHLRLVALPNALLLAGYPDPETLARRHTLAENLLASPWQGSVRARYPGGPIPPVFWHSTLLRYQAERLPETIRRFYHARARERYGEVSLPIRLLATNYNWRISEAL